MENKKGEFAFTLLEAVGRFHDDLPTWSFNPRAYERVYNDRVEEMKARGWDSQRIFKKCTNFDFPKYDGVPMTILIYFNHPIVNEWDSDETRIALYVMAQNKIAKNKVEIFTESMKIPNKRYFTEYDEREIMALEQFSQNLTATLNPTSDIRNR